MCNLGAFVWKLYTTIVKLCYLHIEMSVIKPLQCEI